jgi:hypothetical protein
MEYSISELIQYRSSSEFDYQLVSILSSIGVWFFRKSKIDVDLRTSSQQN